MGAGWQEVWQYRADISPQGDEGLGFGRGSSFDDLLNQADLHLNQGGYAQAVAIYQRILAADARNARALNGAGKSLCGLGNYRDAEEHFRQAVDVRPDFAEAHNNLGYALRMLGRYAEAERSIRRATHSAVIQVSVQTNLGLTLLMLGRPREAEACFSKVQEVFPGDVGSLVGRGHVARFEGRFSEAEALFRKALEARPAMPGVWAVLALLRKMTPKDAHWLRQAEEFLKVSRSATETAELCFSIGKYWDDVSDFDRAFPNYQRANEALKAIGGTYNREARAAYVEDLVRTYTHDAIATSRGGVSESRRPIFIVGMPRSGTSLMERIIAAHPAVYGAGELGFWTEVLLAHADAIRQGVLPRALRARLGDAYLALLAEYSPEAPHIIDKAPVNSELLGLVHSVLPNARIIYMRRNAIDTCLSCYFNYLPPALGYTHDLADLAHYYRTHHRLVAHWRSVLPPGVLLDVSYEELVGDQAGWTRKVLDFLGLEWDVRCLEFQRSEGVVSTSSTWQVRQKIYQSSTERRQHYAKFIGPLLELAGLE